MRDCEIKEHLKTIYNKEDVMSLLTADEKKAFELVLSTYDRQCGNCLFHTYRGKFTKGKIDMNGFQCGNPNSPYKLLFTKHFVTCEAWARREDEDNTSLNLYK